MLAEQGLENVNWRAGSETKQSVQSQPYRFSWECLMLEYWADCAAKGRAVLHGICRAGTVVQLSAEFHLWPYSLYFRTRAQGKAPEVQWQWVSLNAGGTLSRGSPNNRTGRCWRLWFQEKIGSMLPGEKAACCCPQRRQQTGDCMYVTEADTKNTFPHWHL